MSSAAEVTKIIDWDLAIKIANGQRNIAEDILRMLIAELPGVRVEISSSYEKGDWAELKRCVHKLHGGTSYSGVPRLKSVSSQLDLLPPNDFSSEKIQPLIENLLAEIDSLLSAAEGL